MELVRNVPLIIDQTSKEEFACQLSINQLVDLDREFQMMVLDAPNVQIIPVQALTVQNVEQVYVNQTNMFC